METSQFLEIHPALIAGMEASHLAMAIADDSFRVIWANSRFGRIANRSPEELPGMLLKDLWDLPAGTLPRYLPASLPKGKPGSAITRGHNQKGTAFRLELKWEPVHGPGDSFALFTAINLDEKENQERFERHLVSIIEQSDDGIISKDLNGTVLTWNRGAESLFGYKAEEILGRSISCLIPPDRLSEEQEFLNRIQSGQRIDHYETRRIRKDGKSIFVSVSISPLLDEKGKVIGASKIARDITQKKEDLESLLQSRERLNLALETSNIGLWEWTIPTGHVEYSDTLIAMLGYAREEFPPVVATWENLVHPEDRERVQKALKEACQGRTPLYRNEHRLKTRQGTWRWVLDCGRVIERDDAGNPIRMIGTHSDINDRIQAEQSIRQWSQELEKKVEIRTEELSLANAAIARGARAKDEFLAGVSHELRTPLNGILALAEALQDEVYGPITPSHTQAIKDIEQSGRHLLTLINDILDLSKAEVGQMTLDLGPILPGDLANASLRMVKELAQKKNLKVETRIDPAVDLFYSDTRRLKQILVNLLSNAVKFTPYGGSIGVELQGLKETASLKFTVWDNGIGISPEQQKHLFQPFQQIETKLNRQNAGTGLGLSLVLRMTELLGGQVELESEVGKGSRFQVTIPWKTEDSQTNQDTDWSNTGKAIRQAFLIEDSPFDSSHIARYLAEWNIKSQVHPGINGAMERIRMEKPDLVFLDIHLPDGNGLELLKTIKKDPEIRDVPVIIVSVAKSLPLKDLGLEENGGWTDYLSKPIQRDSLKNSLNQLHQNRGAPTNIGAPEIQSTKGSGPMSQMEWKSPTGTSQPQTPELSTGPQSEHIPQAAGEEKPLVLLAEDNELNARTVRDFLKAKGYRVEHVVNGLEAVQRTRELAPRVVLMDIQMPGMDGLEAIREIRSDHSIRQVPILAITALAMEGDREKCLDAGADGYLAKPLSLKKLKEMVDQAIA